MKSGLIIFTTSNNLFGRVQHAVEGGLATHVAEAYWSFERSRYEVLEMSIRAVSTELKAWWAKHGVSVLSVADLDLSGRQVIAWDECAATELMAHRWYDVGFLFGFLCRPLARRFGKAKRDICSEQAVRLIKASWSECLFPGLDWHLVSPADLHRYVGQTVRDVKKEVDAYVGADRKNIG